MTDELLLTMLLDRLGQEFDIQKVVLFGSRAGANFSPESDWDVLVVTNSDLPFLQRQKLAMHKMGRRDFALDLLVFTPEEFQEGCELNGSALYWANQEGRVLYAR